MSADVILDSQKWKEIVCSWGRSRYEKWGNEPMILMEW